MVSNILPTRNYSSSQKRKISPVYTWNKDIQFYDSETNCYLGKENLLQNEEFALEYFEKNYRSHKPLFGTIDDIKLIEKNAAIKRNFCEFWVKKSDEELKKLAKNKFITQETSEKYRGYKQINQFFKEYLELLPKEIENNKIEQVSFAGELVEKDESYCKNLVHGFAGACTLVSMGTGAMNMGSADTWVLRALQGYMFLKMADYLQVPFIASAEYMAKELYSGAVLGTEGAKILTDAAGGFLHISSAASGVSTVSGGSSHALISGATSAIHGSLSFVITEKMGRGYIKRVKNNQMTFKDQSIELASYFGTKAIFGGGLLHLFDQDFAISVDKAFDPEAIKQAYEAIPDAKKELLSEFMNLLKDYNANKLGISFGFNFISRYLLNKKNIHSTEDLKRHLKESFKDALIITSVYDIFDYGVGEVASENAQRTIKDIQENLNNYPEVNKAYKKAEAEFFKNIDLSKIDSNNFQKYFTNKTFLSNLSYTIKDFIKQCRTRKDKKHKEEMENITNAEKTLEDEAAKQKAQEKENINNILNDWEKSLEVQQAAMTSKNDFGYNRIAGYDKQKELISHIFLVPIFVEKTNSKIIPPKGIILYGPTNTGKTTLAKGIVEQARCRLDNIALFKSDENIVEQLVKIQQNSKLRFNEKKQRTIIKIDEIEGLNNKPKALAKLKEILSDETSRISLIATTNEPSQIDKKLSEGIAKIYMEPANRKNVKNILSYYMKEEKRQNINFEEIVQAIFNKKGIYSNKQLQIIADALNKSENTTTQNINDIINSIAPEIAREDLKKYEEI